MSKALLALALITSLAGPAPAATPIKILFVGNSYTFGRANPVMGYNAAAVHDLTASFNAVSAAGTNSHPVGTSGRGSFEPHPWGGVPGIFKRMTDAAGLSYDVSLSTRNAASLRGHFLNLYGKAWDLRGNVASQAWDVVVLQEQSDGALPSGKARHAGFAALRAYAIQFERFIHDGAERNFTETQLFGGLAACLAAGQPQTACDTHHHIHANANASPATRIYLEQTWARPDMVEAHRITRPDLATADGRPIAAGGTAMSYYTDLAGMTADLRQAFNDIAASHPGFAGVVPVGDAFQRAIDEGLARGRGFYDTEGRFATDSTGPVDLWWLDRTHASKYGSYLSALTLFGAITGLDPLSLGSHEQAAVDLGLDATTARALQRVASRQLGFDGAPAQR
ncbi:hypothetical protein [Roseateles sp.]|uniref:hypothetical protein n=1 Tax=Roseateles sp. TaxID=1971397 RepID=UPI0039EB369E